MAAFMVSDRVRNAAKHIQLIEIQRITDLVVLGFKFYLMLRPSLLGSQIPNLDHAGLDRALEGYLKACERAEAEEAEKKED